MRRARRGSQTRNRPTTTFLSRGMIMVVSLLPERAAELAHSAVAALPEIVRADVCQDIIVALLSGDLVEGDIGNAVRGFARNEWKLLQDPWRQRSLDSPVNRDSKTPLSDILQFGDEDIRSSEFREAALDKVLQRSGNLRIRVAEHIARPGWEKELRPLFMFMGTKPHRIRAMWNLAYGMFLLESPRFTKGYSALEALGLSHACGLHRAPTCMSVRGIFSRLRGCPEVTESISGDFTRYVKWLHPQRCYYHRVPLAPNDHFGRVAWWRRIA